MKPKKQTIFIGIASTIFLALGIYVSIWFISETSNTKNPLNRELVLALAGKRFEEAANIIEQGADVNHAFEHTKWVEEDYRCIGWRPLHFAAFHGDVDMAKLLIYKGANPNARIEKQLYVPLHLAVFPSKYRGEIPEDKIIQIIEILNEGGADVNAMDRIDRTPIFWAIEQGFSNAVKTLINSGAKINIKDKGTNSPLLMAVRENNVDLVKIILESRIGAKGEDSSDKFSLLYSIKKVFSSCAKYLANRSVNVNIRARDGTTPLHAAVRNNHLEIIKLLIAAGANPNSTDESGMTPLIEARALGFDPIVALLLQHDANE